MNAVARHVCSAQKYDHVTPLLRDLHWQRAPERIAYRLAVLAFRCQHGLAPLYLSTELQLVAYVDSRQRLRSASTMALVVPRTQHSTIDDRAFSVAATSCHAVPITADFQVETETELFVCSYSV